MTGAAVCGGQGGGPPLAVGAVGSAGSSGVAKVPGGGASAGYPGAGAAAPAAAAEDVTMGISEPVLPKPEEVDLSALAPGGAIGLAEAPALAAAAEAMELEDAPASPRSQRSPVESE